MQGVAPIDAYSVKTAGHTYIKIIIRRIIMESKVLMFDVDNNKIGETFTRRAKQLVKQQRAIWLDESQRAIRFLDDGLDYEINVEAKPPSYSHAPHWETESEEPLKEHYEEWLVTLAQKRIKDRKRFIIHSIIFIPVVLFIFSISNGNRTLGRDAAMLGSWFTAYAIHTFQFVIPKIKAYLKQNRNRDEQRARKLAAEIALLKSEFQR